MSDFLRDAVMGEVSTDPRVLRARALDFYLAEVEQLLKQGKIPEAQTRLQLMRRWISVVL